MPATKVFVLGSALAILLLGAQSVPAHEERALTALTVIDDVVPRMEGIDVRITHTLSPVILLRNETDETLVVFGEAGEPFLRFAAGVEVNLRSPTTFSSLDPTGERPLPGKVDTDAAPRWRTVDDGRTWGWFDPRLRFHPHDGFHQTWQIAARVGERRFTIAGSFEPLEGHGHFVTELDVIEPNVSDLEIRLLEGQIPAVYVANHTRRVFAVRGLQDEPFLEIGPRGVFANLRSPTYYLAGGQVIRDVPDRADPEALPRWKHLSPEPIWSFLEYRARVPKWNQLRAELGAARRTILTWTTPARLGEMPLDISGHVDWVPVDAHPVASDGDDPSAVFMVGGLALAGVVVLIARARRRGVNP